MALKENTREKLMFAAVELFADYGYDGTSTRDICKIANTNISSISYYFKSKQGLYEAIIREFMEDIVFKIKQKINMKENLDNYSKDELVNLMFKSADALVCYIYLEAPKKMLNFVLSDQRRENSKFKNPPYAFFRKILAQLLKRDEFDNEIAFKSSGIIGVVAFPKLMPMFTIKLLGKDDFTQEDIELIREMTKNNVSCVLKSFNIEHKIPLN